MNINGPVNVIRVEGQINNIKKHLYMFMDYHVDVKSQTQCKESDSIDVMQYIYKSFADSDKAQQYDFFLEITKTNVDGPQSEIRGRYIDEVMKFFSQQIKANKTPLDNVRFHGIDERDYLKSEVNSHLDKIGHTIQLCWNDGAVFVQDYELFFNSLASLRTIIKTLYDKLYVNKTVKKSKNLLDKFIFKIRDKYRHANTKKSMKDLVMSNKQQLIEILNTISALENLLMSSKHLFENKNGIKLYNYGMIKTMSYSADYNSIYKLLQELKTKFDYLEILCLFTYAQLVDMFFLRRFIDKDYVKNSVVYTGMSHSIVYIYILVKYFDFKITHVAEINNKSTDALEKLIKQTSYSDLYKIEQILFPSSIFQCSKLNGFPINFN